MKPKTRRISWSCLIVFFTILAFNASTVFSAVPHLLNYQGSLSDASGNPVNATVTMTFALYKSTDPSSQALWMEVQSTVVVENGLFSVQLGEDTQNPLDPAIFQDPIFLGIKVGRDAEMTPRQKITSVGFAFRARESENGVPAGAVMHFNLASCPDGWSDLAAAQGRTLVGATTRIGETVGTALGNLENRLHNHSVDPVAVTSSSAGSHTHSVDPPVTFSTFDSHNHAYARKTSDNRWHSYDSGGFQELIFSYGDGMDEGGVGIFPLATITNITLYTDNDSHNHIVDIASFTSSTAEGHTHAVDIPVTATTSTSAVTPYIQLRVCQKD